LISSNAFDKLNSITGTFLEPCVTKYRRNLGVPKASVSRSSEATTFSKIMGFQRNSSTSLKNTVHL
jgi:hypothetical protein